MARDEQYMLQALEEAKKASLMGEVPVGALVVDGEGNVLASTHNLCETERMPTHHAELLAIQEACRKKGSWRLSDCTVYVTLEPCPMCMGAMIHARVKKVVFGAPDPRAGACGSLIDLANYPLECSPDVLGGILAEPCLIELRDFFNRTRNKK